MEELSLETLRERFQPFDIRHNPEKYHLDYLPGVFRKASVLIPLFYRDGDYRVILTKRSKDLTHHAGYVAFPGGMKDDDDVDEIHTALREAEEEIGLDPKLVDVVCVSGPGYTRPNSIVYPVIGLVRPGFQLTRNEKEVELVFELPVSRFLSEERLSLTEFVLQTGIVFKVHHFLDTVRRLEVDTDHGHKVDTIQDQEVDTWGFTASFCINTALVLYQSDKTFHIFQDKATTKNEAFTLDVIKSVVASMPAARPKL